MIHFHQSSFRSLTLKEAFENYKLAVEKHEREKELARQNYGGWNYTHSTGATLREHREALIRRFGW